MSGSECCKNPPSLNPGSGEGHVEEIGGVKSYVTGSPDFKLSIVLVSDIFGYDAPNLRKVADKVSGAGFYVVVPDFFHGDPFPREAFDHSTFQIWIKNHSAAVGFEEAKQVIEAIKSKGVSSVGAAGFCWGAKVVVELAKHASYIQAAVLLHPSLVTVDDIEGVKTPIAVLGAEIDKTSPPELVQKFEEALKAKPEVGSLVKIFPGVEHGWTIRYEMEAEAAVKSAEEAHGDMLEWFSKYVT